MQNYKYAYSIGSFYYFYLILSKPIEFLEITFNKKKKIGRGV